MVDDDVAVRDALHVLLDDAYEVVDAPDARAALAALESRPVDAALLDIVLPGTDGLELLRDLRVLHPDLPVVMLTAVTTVTTAVEAMKLGALDYLAKPFDVDELLGLVRTAVGQRGRAQRRPGAVASGRRPPSLYVTRAVEYLTTHYPSPLTVATVARAVGVSESHLAHVFRAETGTTVRAFLLRTRVQAALGRLESSDAKMSAIARAAGFCDASHMTRAVLRLTGRRPNSYRGRTQ